MIEEAVPSFQIHPIISLRRFALGTGVLNWASGKDQVLGRFSASLKRNVYDPQRPTDCDI